MNIYSINFWFSSSFFAFSRFHEKRRSVRYDILRHSIFLYLQILWSDDHEIVHENFMNLISIVLLKKKSNWTTSWSWLYDYIYRFPYALHKFSSNRRFNRCTRRKLRQSKSDNIYHHIEVFFSKIYHQILIDMILTNYAYLSRKESVIVLRSTSSNQKSPSLLLYVLSISGTQDRYSIRVIWWKYSMTTNYTNLYLIRKSRVYVLKIGSRWLVRWRDKV